MINEVVCICILVVHDSAEEISTVFRFLVICNNFLRNGEINVLLAFDD